MNSLFDFIIDYRPWIPLKNYNTIRVFHVHSNEDFQAPLDTPIFKNDEELYSYMSEKLTNYIFQEYKYCLEDLKPILPEIDFTYRAWEKETIGNNIFFNHIELERIGFTKFAIYGNSTNSNSDEFGVSYGKNDVLVVDLSYIPNYERMVIENFIWEMCVDEVINKLRKITSFNIDKVLVEGAPSFCLYSNYKIAQINTINQLQMYVERHCYNDLFLVEKLLKSKITIQRSLINFPLEELPRYVDINVMLWKINGNPDYVEPKEFYQLEKIRFQLVINADMSISLIPHPKDMEMIILKQISILDSKDAFTHYQNYLVFSDTFLPLFEYLYNNKLASNFGEIDKFLEDTDSETKQLKYDMENYYAERGIYFMDWWGACFIKLKN